MKTKFDSNNNPVFTAETPEDFKALEWAKSNKNIIPIFEPYRIAAFIAGWKAAEDYHFNTPESQEDRTCLPLNII